MKNTIRICLLALAITMTAAGLGSADTQNPDLSTNDPNRAWTIEFTHSPDIDYIDREHIYVKGENGNLHNISLSVEDETKVVITPTVPYERNREYTIHIEPTVRSSQGAMLSSAVTRTFSVNESAVSDVTVVPGAIMSTLSVSVTPSHVTAAEYTYNNDTYSLHPSGPSVFSSGYLGLFEPGETIDIVLYSNNGEIIETFTYTVKGD